MYVNFLNSHLKRKYGKKLYKLSVAGGFTCPNRDGTIGYGGCIFCSGEGSGEFAEKDGDVLQQLERAKARVERKNRGGGYIAYFQAFTNTYAPAERLRKLYYEAISPPEINVLSVATRPDCIPDDTLELLAEVNRIKPVWVELGLQTVKEETVKYIRRGYGNDVFDDAVRRLKEAGIEVIVHMILGLPGESANDMVETAEYIGRSGADGIKLQLLHVLKGTDLEKEYLAGKFDCLSLSEYTDIVIECLKVLPPEMVIHRITGDGPKRELIAPEWSGDKKRVLNFMNKALRDRNVRQGENYIKEKKL